MIPSLLSTLFRLPLLFIDFGIGSLQKGHLENCIPLFFFVFEKGSWFEFHR